MTENSFKFPNFRQFRELSDADIDHHITTILDPLGGLQEVQNWVLTIH